MAGRNALRGDEVYVLTDRGEAELHGSGTTLSPAEIELLVRLDGVSTADAVTASCRLLKPAQASEILGSLLDRRLLQLRSLQAPVDALGGIDAAGLFGVVPAAAATRGSLTRAREEASTGVARLQKQGYFVRIARRRVTRPKVTPGGKLSAVVVEDEPLLAKFLKQYLSFDGFDVRTAGDREGIVAAFRSPPLPDLVLLDVMLPDADGFDILNNMRRHPALKSVPVIMLTAKATRESVLKGVSGGADGYITKPFEADTLLKAVRTVLGLPQDPAAAKGGDTMFRRR